MSQTKPDNILNTSPKHDDDKTGVFQAGVWRPYNNISEYTTRFPTLAARAETQSIYVRSIDDAKKVDLYLLDKDKAPYLFKKGVESVEEGEIGPQGPQGPKGNDGNVFILPFDTPADIYDTYALGVSGTLDGDLFGVVSSDEKTIITYKNVDGFGVYIKTDDWVGIIKDFDYRRKAIVYGATGNISPSAVIDFDSSELFVSGHKIRNLVNPNKPDERFIGQDFDIQSQGVEITSGTFGGRVGYKVDFPASSIDLGQTPFVHFKSNNEILLPSGQWTFAYDIRMPDGQSKTVSFKDRWGGSFPAPDLELTDEWQTVKCTVVIEAEESYITYAVSVGEKELTPTVGFTAYISNLRVVAGAEPLQEVDQFAINAPNRAPRLSPFSDGMIFDTIDLTQTLKAYPLTPITFKSVTIAAAFKLVDYGATNGYTMFWGYNPNGYFGLQHGIFKAGGNFFVSDYNELSKVPLNQWLVIIAVCEPTKTSYYINGVKHLEFSAGGIESEINIIEIFTAQGNVYKPNCKISSWAIWNKALSAKQIEETNQATINRIVSKGEVFEDIRSVVIMEGDSITWLPTSFSTKIQSEFTPVLTTIKLAENGRILGSPGDPFSVNSLFGKLPKTLERINDNITAGRIVIVTVLIGANDIIGIGTPEDVEDYYERLVIYWNEVRKTGSKVIAATMTDRADTIDKTYIDMLNDMIISDETKYDAVVDYYADPRLTPAISPYFYDGTHPSDEGGEVMAELLIPEINKFWEE